MPLDIARNLDTLIAHGVNIDINQLTSKIPSYDDEAKEALCAHGYQG